MEKKKKTGYPPYDLEDSEDTEPVVSSTDCTGLQPTPPISENAAQSYGELYNIPQSTKKVNNSLQNIKKIK